MRQRESRYMAGQALSRSTARPSLSPAVCSGLQLGQGAWYFIKALCIRCFAFRTLGVLFPETAVTL